MDAAIQDVFACGQARDAEVAEIVREWGHFGIQEHPLSRLVAAKNLDLIHSHVQDRGLQATVRLTGKLCQDQCKEGHNLTIGGEFNRGNHGGISEWRRGDFGFCRPGRFASRTGKSLCRRRIRRGKIL